MFGAKHLCISAWMLGLAGSTTEYLLLRLESLPVQPLRMIGVRCKIRHLCTAWWCIWSGYWVSWPAVLACKGRLCRESRWKLSKPIEEKLLWTVAFQRFYNLDRFCYGSRLTQNCMLMQGHNLLANLLARKQSTTNEASGFQPLLSRRCKFRELPSASQHFVVRHQDRNKFTKDIRLGVFTTMCLGNVRHHKFRRLRLARARFATNQHHLPMENASNMRCSRLFVCLCAACLWVCHVRTNFNLSQSSRNGQSKKWPDWFLHAAEGPVKLCSKKTQLTVQESFCDFSKSLKKQWRRLDCMQTQRIDVGW